MKKTGNDIRIALITTTTPVAKHSDKNLHPNVLFNKLAERDPNVIVDIYTWNIENISHKQSVLIAEHLECGLTSLRTPLFYKLFPINRFYINHQIKEHIINTYDTVWLNGKDIGHLAELFPDKRIFITAM